MIHNLDEGLEEYFEFVLKGLTYKVRYPTSEEIDKLAEEKDDGKVADIIYGFIESPEGQPPFSEAIKKVNIKARNRFLEMIKKEFNANL